MQRSFLIAALLFLTYQTSGQNYWSPVESARGVVPHKSVSRVSFPSEYKLFSLDADEMRRVLFSVVDGRGNGQGAVIQLPNAAGTLESFHVVEASNFEPALQRQFPLIRAFSGKGIDDPAAMLKLSISPEGIQTMLFRTDRPNEFIEQYSNDAKVYAVFHSQRNKGVRGWVCSTPEAKLVDGLDKAVQPYTQRSGGNLKTLRLAQSVTAEYSNYFGATSSAQVGLVLAAVNATMSRTNGCYEKDLALHLNLIANTTAVFYYNPSTDPYSAASQLSNWNSQLQSTLTSLIGDANYDIGHLFGASGGGGNAGCIGCICASGKGSAYTSPADGIPRGDNFDIDYVAHEVGHQLGANHTFSHSNEGTGVNMEVGSGITIMGYAGITAQDVANHSIDIFHQASIRQVQANIETKTCPVTYSGVNATPQVSSVPNYTIPINTPFELTGVATDADAGDVLTYCWEQNNNSTTTGASSVASPTKTTGPNWITFPATTNPTRTFPRLATLLTGASVTGPLTGGDAGANTEALSSVSRTLNFRLTVRDNRPYNATTNAVGQTQFTDMTVTVSNAVGSFLITSQNTATSWTPGTSQTITWTVNGTTGAPTNTANVDILFSSDGGNTFTTLLANTPNDGTQVITVPNTATTTGRVKVKAVNNIYFDINNANITITAPPTCGIVSGLAQSNVTFTSADLSWSALSGANSYDVDYKASSSANWISVATGTTVTTASLAGLTQSTLYDWRVRATCAAGTSNYSSAQFSTVISCVAPTGLSTTSLTSSSAVLNWASVPGASNYTVEYRLSASSTWTIAAAANTTTSFNLTALTASTAYVWRVRSNCSLNQVYSADVNFSTTAPVCISIYDVSTNGTTSGAALIPFNIDIPGSINVGGDNDYYRFNISRTGTLSVALTNLAADYNLRLYRGNTLVASSLRTGTINEAITNYNANRTGTYYVRVSGATTAAFNASICYNLRVNLGTAAKTADGVAAEVGTEWTISPNPVNRQFLLRGGDLLQPAQVRIYNLSGKLLQQRDNCIGAQSFDLTGMPRGVYMVRIITDQTTQTIKLIKQ